MINETTAECSKLPHHKSSGLTRAQELYLNWEMEIYRKELEKLQIMVKQIKINEACI